MDNLDILNIVCNQCYDPGEECDKGDKCAACANGVYIVTRTAT